MGLNLPLLSMQLGGLGKCCELPMQSPGRSPSRKDILEHFGTPETTYGDSEFCVFVVQKAPYFGPLDPKAPALRGLRGQ